MVENSTCMIFHLTVYTWTQDELEIKLDDKKEPAAVPNGQPAPPPGISSVNKYVRPGSAQAVADRKPSQPLSQPMKGKSLIVQTIYSPVKPLLCKSHTLYASIMRHEMSRREQKRVSGHRTLL